MFHIKSQVSPNTLIYNTKNSVARVNKYWLVLFYFPLQCYFHTLWPLTHTLYTDNKGKCNVLNLKNKKMSSVCLCKGSKQTLMTTNGKSNFSYLRIYNDKCDDDWHFVSPEGAYVYY